ncbi:MrcB family domain-containing protein [Nonomuraea sp. bgisy101]|uniref:MrcB family domain-containing protein n=1 Tax=Nonomuraea sp. bgisy101 TaxID=3413784 RepID=UPI003D74658B
MVELRWLIGRIGETYDRSLRMTGEAQQLLRQAGKTILQWVPPGYTAEGSGGKGAAANVPWISVFDPDETDTARHGMYVVYLFAQDMQSVALSLNQGVTELIDRYRTKEGRRRLKEQADAIRAALPTALTTGLEPAINLQTKEPLPRHYEFGNIVAKTYKLSDLPDEATMVDDLGHFIQLYQEALVTREAIRQTTPETIVTTVRPPDDLPPAEPALFKPKSSADYVATITGRTIVKSRTHERILKEYGNLLQARGLSPNTRVHPRDMTVIHNGEEWLIEVKMVRRGDAVGATREAIGQLMSYRHFLYEGRRDQVKVMAVFNESIGEACEDLLESLGIAAVWREGTTWKGSPSARAVGLG